MMICLPAMLAVTTVLLGLPFGVISALSLVAVDWSAPLAGPYLRIVAEASPAGTWNVTQFPPHLELVGLFHSQAYQNWDAKQFIADWVLGRAWSAEANG